MKKSQFIFISFICITIYCISALYSLSESNVEDIIICSTNNDTHYIPSDVCEFYLLNYRTSKEDIKVLEAGAGLAFLFEINDEGKRFIYIDHFLSNGLSIDAQSNVDGLPPLHSAIILNDAKLVKYLLEKGADINQIDKNNQLAPLNFLQMLKERNRLVNRDSVTKVLSLAREIPNEH